MMRAVAELGAAAGCPSLRLARTGHGLRDGRLLQLRRAASAATSGHHFVRSCVDGPVFDASVLDWHALGATGH